MSKILITGANGFIGRNLLPILEEKYSDCEIIKVSRTDFDLTKELDVVKMFSTYEPQIVIHLAGKVGGILANRDYPVEFFNENILMNTYVFKYAREFKVEKLVTFMGGCSYPGTAKSPINESEMWNGYPQGESAAYSIAKKNMIVQSIAYRKQYNFNSIVLIPGNIYGEYDDFDLKTSHVIPALIRKFYEAKINGDKSVTLWGTGEPIRDFVYIKDVVNTIPYFIDNYDSSEPINISSGLGITIKSLSNKIKDIVGYEGNLIWDTEKPNGQMIKTFDVSNLNKLGLYCDTTIYDGIKNTLEWYKKQD